MDSEGIPEKSLRSADAPVFSDESEESISLLDILLVLIRRRKVIGKTLAVSLVIGLALAVFSPTKYTATAKVIRESAGQEVGGLSGLAALRGFGINIGGGASGLTEENYPEILRSRELLLAVVNSPFYFNDLDTSMSLVEYQTRHPGLPKILIKSLRAVTIDLPGNILRWIRGVDSVAVVPEDVSNIVGLSRDEYDSIKFLNSIFSDYVDRSSGMMTISTTTRDPLLSAQIVVTLIDNLRLRVQDLFTEKARENLEFIQARFNEVRVDLEEAEGDLARFLDANQNPQTARLRFEVERLQRQVDVKTALYRELQTQMMQAEIELQHEQPVITVVEAPVPPLEKSAPKRKLIVVMSLMLGLFAGVGLAYIGQFINNLEGDKSQEQSLEEIKATLDSSRWLGKLFSLFRRKPA